MDELRRRRPSVTADLISASVASLNPNFMPYRTDPIGPVHARRNSRANVLMWQHDTFSSSPKQISGGTWSVKYPIGSITE